MEIANRCVGGSRAANRDGGDGSGAEGSTQLKNSRGVKRNRINHKNASVKINFHQ